MPSHDFTCASILAFLFMKLAGGGGGVGARYVVIYAASSAAWRSAQRVSGEGQRAVALLIIIILHHHSDHAAFKVNLLYHAIRLVHYDYVCRNNNNIGHAVRVSKG